MEISVSQWGLTLTVRCQVELCVPRKKGSIVCESPSHCHSTSPAARRDGGGKLPKWFKSLLGKVIARGSVFYCCSQVTSSWKMPRGLHRYNYSKWECRDLLGLKRLNISIYMYLYIYIYTYQWRVSYNTYGLFTYFLKKKKFFSLHLFLYYSCCPLKCWISYVNIFLMLEWMW